MANLRLILDEIAAERARQVAKWGEQNHPSVDTVLVHRCDPQRTAEEYEIPTASRARFMCQEAFRKGEGTWTHIALEEFSEAVEAATIEGDPLLRAELIQLGAVIAAWIESIDRNSANATGIALRAAFDAMEKQAGLADPYAEAEVHHG